MTPTDGDLTELEQLETAMWQLPTRGDRAWMDRHLAPGFTEFGRSGRTYTRADILDLPIGEIAIDLPLRDFTARAIAPGAVLTTYRSIEARGPSNRSSIWRRTERGWQLEFHHGSPAD